MSDLAPFEILTEMPPPPDVIAARRRASAAARPAGAPEVRGEVIAAASEGEPGGDWQDRLVRDGKGHVVRCAANASLILTHDEPWRGVIAWDTWRQAIVSTRRAPWDRDDAPADAERREWIDSDIIRCQSWLARHWSLRLGRESIGDAVRVVAERTVRHEVREYLEGLRWDGVARVADWLHRYLGATDDAYGRLAGGLYLVAAVARVSHPGAKVDTMLVLEGPQGSRKSSALRTLFSEQWFSDTPIELESKDRFVALRGRWCLEMAELDSLRRAEVTRIKSFLSSCSDSFRPPYGRALVTVPRQCVFAGTTNQREYLRDATGNRRFWPVACGRIDLEALARDRDQLWAEAVQIHSSGGRWWPDGDAEVALCADAAADREQTDPWEAALSNWAAGRSTVTMDELLGTALDIEPGRRTRADESRAGAIMHRLGWRRVRLRVGERRVRNYVRPAEIVEGGHP